MTNFFYLNTRTLNRLIMVAGLAAGIMGVTSRLLLNNPKEASHLPNSLLWKLPLHDLTGKATQLAPWQGKRLVVNFWATWCAPCREEIPALNQFAQTHPDVQIIGIAIDRPEQIRQFLTTLPTKYPILVGNYSTLEILFKSGNSEKALPFTIILNPERQLAITIKGAITANTLNLYF